MYSTHGGQRRGLLKAHSSSHSGPVFRNLPLFGFLAGLVIFFYVFYVYQAQNAEMALLREQYDVQQSSATKLKSENIDLKLQLEKYKDKEQDWNREKSSQETKLNDCSRDLRTEKRQTEDERTKVMRLQTEKDECSSNLQTAKLQMEQQNDTISAMRTVGVNNEAVIITMNETIKQLRAELTRLKSAPLADVANANSANLVNKGPGERREVGGIGGNEGNPVDGRQQGVNAAEAPLVQSRDLRNEAERADNARVAVPPAVKEPAAAKMESRISSTTAAAPMEAPKLNDVLGIGRPAGPGDRVKMEEKQMNEKPDEGKLVVPDGEYRNSEEEGVIARPKDDAAPDFENDEKRIKEPDV